MKSLFLLLILGYHSGLIEAIDRVYYVQAEEVEWDYLGGSGMNKITGENITEDSDEGIFFYRTDERIGSIYKKALYREYTDSSFTTRAPRPEWLGHLGPILRGVTGDRIIIHFRNNASYTFTMHPHGVMYEKDSEGAKYTDGTSDADTADGGVPPGGRHTYVWLVEEGRTTPPNDSPENCRAWPYHSHHVTQLDENAGLFGFIITCKPDTLDGFTDFVLYEGYINEGTSMYLDENIANYVPNLTPEQRASRKFRWSNHAWNINGLAYGNLPGLEMCAGDRVRWFTLTFGETEALHSFQFNGNPLLLNKRHRRNIVPLLPASSTEADMYAVNPGTWLLHSGQAGDGANGASALYTVRDCGNDIPPTILKGKTREYFIQIEEVDWNYAPLQYPFGNETGAPVFRKAVYREYNDSTFRHPVPRPFHMGFIGPIIKAEVGDTVKVTLRNKADNETYNIHPDGMMYNKANEGELYQDGTDGAYKLDDGVAPGQTYTYTWTLPSYYGPTDADSNCITSMYYSTYNAALDKNSGLIGPMVLCKRGSLENGIQREFDRMFVLMFIFINEEDTRYWDFNEARGITYQGTIDELVSLNGYVYGNMRGLDTCLCDRVQWHVASVANEEFFLGAYFEGHVFTYDGQRQDTVKMNPGEAFPIEMEMRNPGTWRLFAEIDRNIPGQHLTVNYTVADCLLGCVDEPGSGVTREFHLAAEEIVWDYNPLLYNFIAEQNLTNPDSPGHIYMAPTDTTIGNRYYKIQYVEYTDSSFTTKKTRRSEDEYLGYLGPVIRAEIFDTVKITFRNMMDMDLTINAHGIYDQTTYYNGRTYTGAVPIKPGDTAVFTWQISPSSGPSDTQPNCIVWPYQSDVNPVRDQNSGLIGGLVVCRQGILDATATRTDVDREFVVLFRSQDENDSWLLDKSIRALAPNPDTIDKEDEDFIESNDLSSVNGRMYGYPLQAIMHVGELVAWQIMSLGGGGDVHTIHFHGHTLLERFDRVETLDVILALPGTFSTVEMYPEMPGTWLLHCHVSEHIAEGMLTTYQVLPALPTVPGSTVTSPVGAGATATVYRSFMFVIGPAIASALQY